jgi:hypothetical protein
VAVAAAAAAIAAVAAAAAAIATGSGQRAAGSGQRAVGRQRAAGSGQQAGARAKARQTDQIDIEARICCSNWPADEEMGQVRRGLRSRAHVFMPSADGGETLPILVAAAVNYEIVNLARQIAKKIKGAAYRGWAGPNPRIPNALSFQQIDIRSKNAKHELQGGIVVIGRPTFKEFVGGLKRGWTERPGKVGKEEMLDCELQDDGVFGRAYGRRRTT